MSKLNHSRLFDILIISFSLKPSMPEAPKLVCPSVLSFRMIITFKLVKKYEFDALINLNKRFGFIQTRTLLR